MIARCGVGGGSACRISDRVPGVVVPPIHWALRRLLELLIARFRSDRSTEIEILVLRP
jgi:hypothetical protein